MGKDVIIACDFAKKTEVLDFLSAFTDRKPFIKIGMEPVSYTHLCYYVHPRTRFRTGTER